MDLSNIYTKHWQIGLGTVSPVLDIEDIKQCIHTILMTRPGSDPLRPHFGCGIFDDIDKPVNSIVPSIKKKIVDALSKYEPRIEIIKIIVDKHGDE